MSTLFTGSGMSKSKTPGGYSYQQGTNKLIHIEGTPPIDYGYNSNGNITSETGWIYVYDFSNQLIRVLNGNNQIAEYTYNGAGQRIKKVIQTETRIFHYDLLGHLIAETNQSGQMLAEYVYLGDQLLVMIKPGEMVFYYNNDHLGTPQALTTDSGGIAWKAIYTPFGEAVASIQTVENPFRFPGQYYDQETGLHYNWNRYYDPKTGRYLTPDPIGLEGGINLFVYVGNNPLNLLDPLGLVPCSQIDKEVEECLDKAEKAYDDCMAGAEKAGKECLKISYSLCDKLKKPVDRKVCKNAAKASCAAVQGRIEDTCLAIYIGMQINCEFPRSDKPCEREKEPGCKKDK